MLDIVTYSYLIFPLLFLVLRGKFKETIFLVLALYGLSFFSLIFFDPEIPKNIKKYYQGFYTLLEYTIFTYIFWVNNKNKAFRKFVTIASILFLLFELYYVSTTDLQKLDSVPIGIETILVFIYIFCFFFDFSKNVKDTFIYNHYCFWISVGILIYLGGSFFYYILVNHLKEEDVQRFGNLTYVAEIFKNLLFCVAIFMYKKYQVNNIHNHPKNIPNLDMI